MRGEIPILRQISLDLERSARELQVFWAAIELLDLVDVRPLPIAALESTILRQQRDVHGKQAAGLSKSTIAHALAQLEAAGYLRRTTEGYRVPLSRGPSSVVAVESREPRRSRRSSVGVVSEVI